MSKKNNNLQEQNSKQLQELLRSFYNIVLEHNPERLIQNKSFYSSFFTIITKNTDVLVKDLAVSLILEERSSTIQFNLNHNDVNWKLSIPLKKVSPTDFEEFLLGNINFWEYLSTVALSNDVNIDFILNLQQIQGAFESWNKYVAQLGYDEEKHLLNFSDSEIKKALKNKNIVWYYGSSCSGKTYMAIRELRGINTPKIVYNPCFSPEFEYDFIKIMLLFGENVAILLDDLQCDTEKAREIFSLISTVIDTLNKRNVYIFLISWTSLILDDFFSYYQTVFNAVEVHITKYISQLQESIQDGDLKIICGNNLALLNVASSIVDGNNDNPEGVLFEEFIRTKELHKLSILYRLCVLGTYEYLISTDSVDVPITPSDISTIKITDGKYYVGHKEICRFLATYIMNHRKRLGISSLPDQDKIIYEFIQSTDSINQWKAIKQLIGEQPEDSLQDISPIWKGLHRFEQEISSQTDKDPTWGNTPSSMYFVLKVASLLGVVSEYKTVLHNFCSKFVIIDSKIKVNYSDIATTNDFNQIKRKMIEEDHTTPPNLYESGEEFDCNRAHKNWLLGLIVGLKNELYQFGYQNLYDVAESELFDAQDISGFWYPRRIPWVSARILIGLSQAGYSASNDKVSRGISFLFECLGDNDHWDAHTGQWNTPYETSSLCLEAIYNAKRRITGPKKTAIDNVVQYLLNSKTEWMKDENVVDGSATACCLLKNYDYSSELIDYIQHLCKQRIYSIIAKNSELDLFEQQSCETTQVAYYIMDFCWDILYTHLPDLLNQFISRSLQVKKKEGEHYMKKPISVFISYSEDSKATINRVQKISSYLRSKGYNVLCYADEPLGTNIVSFMQKVPMADLILIMGSKSYKEKSLRINDYCDKGSGVFFENLILSQLFIQSNMDKIIPIAFEKNTSFEESFPPPFSTNKGLSCHAVNKSFLENLVKQIDFKFGGK